MDIKKCSKCHETKPFTCFHKNKTCKDGYISVCKTCRSNHMSNYYEKNNKEIRSKQNDSYKNNKEYYKNKNAKYYEDNKQVIIKRSIKYLKNNPEYRKLKRIRRDTLEKYLPRNITRQDIEKINETFKGKCSLSSKDGDLHNDHFIPLSTGHGGTYIGNIIPLHKDLNVSKLNRNPFEWFKTRSDINIHKFNEVVEYLASLNGLTKNEYKEFVYWCFDNPRDINQIRLDGDKTSLELWREHERITKLEENMYDRHKSGKESEYYVAYHMTKLGYDISFPTGNPKYDLIAENEDGRYFIQVKSTIIKDEQMKVNLRGNSDTKHYTSKDCDCIAIHERSTNQVYFIPIKEIEGQVSICLRLNPPEKIFSHRTRIASDFIECKLHNAS